MIRLRLFLSVCLLFWVGESLSQGPSYAALFGEHAKYVPTTEANTYRIFIDQNGDFYPEDMISDEELRSAGDGQLRVWAAARPGRFARLTAAYLGDRLIYTEEHFRLLQEAIVSRIASDLEVKATDKTLTFLIHGFRKLLYRAEGKYDRTSLSDNLIVEEEMLRSLHSDSTYSSKAPFFVELYWDGKYIPLSSGFGGKVQLAKLFRDGAIPNGQRVGHSLRQLFAKLDVDRVNLLSHSAGVHVVAGLLFNVDSSFHFPTPHQKDVRVAMVAAASSGKKLFKRYYDRNAAAAFDEVDNYTLLNAYNTKDFVLKKLGFSKRYGDTSLGCNCKQESMKLKAYFEERFPNSTYKTLDISIDPPANHYLSKYARSRGFDGIVAFLFKQ